MLGLIARRLKNSCNVLNLRSLQSVQNEVRRNVSTDEDHRHSPHEWRGLKNKNVIAETVDRQNVYHFIINGQHQKQKHYKCWDDWYQLYLVKLTTGFLCSFYASHMICMYARRRQNIKRWQHMEQILAERDYHRKNQLRSVYEKSYVPSGVNSLYRLFQEGFSHELLSVTNDHKQNDHKQMIEERHTAGTQTVTELNVNSAIDDLKATLGHIEFKLGLQNLRAKKPEAAVSHFILASIHNHKEATFNLGLCYEKGTGTSKNLKHAMQCYREAANLGHKGGMYNLGVYYANGLGGLKKNRAAAKECFKAASQMGLTEAKIALGIADERGSIGRGEHQTGGLFGKANLLNSSKLNLLRRTNESHVV